ncbi:MAG: Tol-Pal system beta propeller repeat protein TolB [Rubrivivax sp.]|nr:Tol-Pal system beta propeller repeat protein TolB [Rubrivivax sp.]
MWPRRRFIGSLGAASAALACPPAVAQFRVEISGVGARQIPVAVVNFRDESVTGLAVAGVVRADLQRSGLFRAVEGREALDERSTVVSAEWRARGVDAVVAGSATRLADGRFDLRFKLWDVVKGEELSGQSAVVPAADLRLAAHRIADEIQLALTGERGVNATRIAYVLREGRRYSLRVADADGEGGQVAVASPEALISPAWSPDGKQLAYVSFETQKAVVWVQDVASGQRRRLADFRGSNSAPAWSPDGREIAVALSRDGGTQLFLIPRDGGSPRRLTSSGSIDTEPVFAPDGRSIYFTSDRGGAPQIYRQALAGGSAERVTFSGGHNISPSISADGRTLAYVTRQGGDFRLAVQDLETGAVQLPTDTRDDERPSFAPNGRLIVYATRQGGRDVLMTTTADGRIKTRLLSTGADMREPAWGPFGR